MAERILAGDSLRSVATDLNERSVPTVSGAEWRAHVVRKILLSGRISGQREHHGEILGKAVWPGIIRPRQTLRLRALLGDPARRTKRVPRRYLLASLLRCHACGHPLAARPIDDGRRRYVCAKAPGLPGCGGTFVMAEEIEVHIVEAVLGRLGSPRFEAAAGRRSGQDDARAAQAQRLVDEAHARLEELAEVYGRGEITLREWQAARVPVTHRVEKAQVVLRRQTQTTALEAVLGQPHGPAVAFAALTLARKQAVIAAVMDHAEVGPAVRGRNRFDPSRVRPAWRT
jgi:site-specific DNA recombinase